MGKTHREHAAQAVSNYVLYKLANLRGLANSLLYKEKKPRYNDELNYAAKIVGKAIDDQLHRHDKIASEYIAGRISVDEFIKNTAELINVSSDKVKEVHDKYYSIASVKTIENLRRTYNFILGRSETTYVASEIVPGSWER